LSQEAPVPHPFAFFLAKGWDAMAFNSRRSNDRDSTDQAIVKLAWRKILLVA
jgi:hypothetical protein